MLTVAQDGGLPFNAACHCVRRSFTSRSTWIFSINGKLDASILFHFKFCHHDILLAVHSTDRECLKAASKKGLVAHVKMPGHVDVENIKPSLGECCPVDEQIKL